MTEQVGAVSDCCSGSCCGTSVDKETKTPENNQSGTKLVVQIDGMDCGDCAAKLAKTIGKLQGVHQADVNFATAKMTVFYDDKIVGEAEILKQVHNLGFSPVVPQHESGALRTVFRVDGMDCGDCAAKLEQRLATTPGVKAASVNFGAGKMTVEHTIPIEEILRIVKQSGFQATPESSSGRTSERSAWWKNPRMQATIISGVFVTVAMLFEWLHINETAIIPLYVLAMVTGGFHVAKAGFYSLRSLNPDMNFLMAAAAIGAAAIGEWSEGATVVFLFSLGNALQSYTMDKTRESIRALMDLAPREALVRRRNQEINLPVEEIVVGDVIIVKPGERIAMDGGVIKGASAVNQATITGESVPVEKAVGDVVYAGTLNEHGVLEIVVTKLAKDSTLAKIMHLIEEAQAQKAPSQQFVDVFARYYTPAVILGAAAITIVPWLFFNQPFTIWFYRALVLLVVACPCALIISTPVSIVSAIGSASRSGVLVKGGAYLEEMGKIKAIAFDKTGTLTEGRLTVTNVIPFDGRDEQFVLSIAGSVERWSEHPIAIAIVAKAKGMTLKPIKNFKALIGRGAAADIDGQTIYVGNLRLFTELGSTIPPTAVTTLSELEMQGKTAMFVGTRDALFGVIAVADTIRSNSVEAIRALREAGIEYIVMLTGDNKRVAEAVGSKLGIDQYYGELLPEDKVRTVQSIGKKYGSVAMVGDGVNDAPALATANVGIAMGVAGSDTALETADIALMSDDLGKLASTIKLSRKTVGIIKQNIGFSLVIKGLFIILTAIGFTNLWMAVFADMGSSLLVTLNGMRLARKL